MAILRLAAKINVFVKQDSKLTVTSVTLCVKKVKNSTQRQKSVSVSDEGNLKHADVRGYTKVIWDLINVAWLMNPSWVPTELLRAPRFGDDTRWHHDPDNRHWSREAYAIDRDGIFLDLIQKFERAP